MDKSIIDKFLQELKNKSTNDIDLSDCENDDIKELFKKNFLLVCRKCGSNKVFVSWEEGHDYGEYTGYVDGQKLFKCNDCGNAISFWNTR